MAELADTADGTVHGYVVYYHVQRHVRISDLFCVDPDTVELLLSEFIKLMRKEGATAISMNYCGNPDLPRVLRRFGFSTRADRQTLTIFPPAHAEPSFIMNDANWQFTDGDEEEEVFMAAAQPAPGALPTGPPPAPAELVRQ
jgi:hypothetical protein